MSMRGVWEYCLNTRVMAINPMHPRGMMYLKLILKFVRLSIHNGNHLTTTQKMLYLWPLKS